MIRSEPIRRWVPRLAAAAVVCLALQMWSDNKADVDLWGNVGFVKVWPWQDGFHMTNTYSYTQPDYPWVNHEWGAELAMYWAWRLGGNAGLLAQKLVLGLGVLVLMAAALRRQGVSGATRFFLLLLCVSVMQYGFSTRPHHFTFLMTALFLWAIRFRRHSRWVFLTVLPVLGWVWANLHGAFFIGAILLLAATLGETVRRVMRQDDALEWGGIGAMGGGFVLFLLVSLVNPYGFRLWSFVAESGALMRPYLSEWAPFSLRRDAVTHTDFLVLLAVVFVAYPLARTSRDPVSVVLVILALGAALILKRNIPLFAIIACFTAAREIEALAGKALARLTERIPAVGRVIVLALFLPVSVVYGLTFAKERPFTIEAPPERQPLRAVAFIKANGIEGNAFVFFDWAEYCIWHLWPQCHVFMDGRFRSAYSADVIDAYLKGLYGQPGGERAFSDFDTNMALVHAENPVARQLHVDPEWVLVLCDGPVQLFLKRSAHPVTLAKLARRELMLPPPPDPVFP